MEPKRRIRTAECAQSIRSGTSDDELMEKYGLTVSQLHKVYSKLLEVRAISQDELYATSELYRKRVDELRARAARRVELGVPLWIYEVRSARGGLVRDISETGLRVAGIKSDIGEEKVFQLPLDMFFSLDPLLFTARCMWLETKGKNVQYCVGGYEIADISSTDRDILKKLIGMLLLSGSGEWSTLE